MTEPGSAKLCQTYITGLCPAGRYSSTGRYGPCLKCNPGTFNNKLASKSCAPCPIGKYHVCNTPSLKHILLLDY